MGKMKELSALRDQGLTSDELEALDDIQREDRADRIRKDKQEEETDICEHCRHHPQDCGSTKDVCEDLLSKDSIDAKFSLRGKYE